MRVSRAQAEENREAVIDAASRLFREHGFDGVGLNDVMRAAGLTHGGFYKQFASKDDLVAQACTRALAGSAGNLAQAIASADADPDADADADADAFGNTVRRYLSRDHRDRVGEGCAFAALIADAARHGPDLRRCFEAGVREHLALLKRAMPTQAADDPGTQSIVALATMVGALLLARVVEDEDLSGRILDAATASLLAPPRDSADAQAS